MNSTSCKLVVLGIIRNNQGQILLTQRTISQPMPLFWEFPGGKIHEGETPEQALQRELEEEIGVKANIGALYHCHYYAYPEFGVLLLGYECTIDQAPQAKQVAQAQWVFINEIAEYKTLPADQPFIHKLSTTVIIPVTI